MTKPIAPATTKTRLRKRTSGRIGSAALLSTKTKSGRRTTAAAIRPRVSGESHAYVVPPRLVKRIDGGQAAGEERRPEPVDRVPDAHGRGVEDDRDHGEGERADREVDVEDPPPREVVDEEAAEERADHRRHAEDGAEEALVAAAVARRDHVADHGDGGHDQPTRPEPLEGAEPDQLGHVLAQPAERRADEKDHDRDLEDRFPAVEVAELPVQRAGDRRREQVRGHDPREVLDPAEVADDRRQRGRNDRLVQRREQQDEDERPEDQADPRWLRGHAARRRW